MNNLCMNAEQFVGKASFQAKRENHPQSPTAAAQAFPLSISAQSFVAAELSDLSRVPGHIISCYYLYIDK
jgi:hypothetical protein